MQSTRWFASALFVLCVPIFLLLTNVRVAAMDARVYEYSFATYNVPEVTGVDRPQLDAIFAVTALRHVFVIAIAEVAGHDIELETTIRIRRRA